MLLEKQLIDKCLAKDRQGQFELYKKYSDAMYNICRRMIVREEESQEVLQDAFITIFDKLQTYNYQSSLGAWIKRIVINKCIDHLRVKKELFFEMEESILNIPMMEEEPAHINVRIINDAISQLPSGFRTVFSLYAMEGYDHEEISQIMGISEQTSKSQYHRAKAKLKDLLSHKDNIDKLFLN